MAYLVAIPLRVWLTVLDPDSSGQASLRFAVHRQRQWPSEPKRGMVYEVLIHVISVEDSGGMEQMEDLCSTSFISIWAPKMQTRRWHKLRR
jgi:hypothetical protein